MSGTPVDTKLDRSGTKTYPEAKTLASGAATGVGPGGAGVASGSPGEANEASVASGSPGEASEAGVASGSPGELASSTGVNVKNEG